MTSCCCCCTAGRASAIAGRAKAKEPATGQETGQVKSFLKELFRKVMKPIPENYKATSLFREKFQVLANHGRRLAKRLSNGSASDRPRYTSLYILKDVRIHTRQYLTKKRKHHPSQADDTSTAGVAPGRFGRDEYGEVRREKNTHGMLDLISRYSAYGSKPGLNLPSRSLSLYIYLQRYTSSACVQVVAGTHVPQRGEGVKGLRGWLRHTITYVSS